MIKFFFNSFPNCSGNLAAVEGQRNSKFSHSGRLQQLLMCQSDEEQALRIPGQRSCYCAFRFKCKQLRP